jgi:hypothetical protein
MLVLASCGRIGFTAVTPDGVRDGAAQTDAADTDADPSAPWAMVQHQTASCGGPTTTCSVDVSATGAAHLLVLVTSSNSFQSGDGRIASVTGGGAWTHPPGCFLEGPAAPLIDCAYVTSSDPGATSVTVTYTGENDHAQDVIVEYSHGVGGIVFDNLENAPLINATDPAGVAVIAAGDDVVVEAISFSAAVTAVDATFTVPATFANDGGVSWIGVAGRFATGTVTAPTWTAPFGQGDALALAFQAP